MTKKLTKGARITGPERTELVEGLVLRYERGESIRSIAADIGRSYGFVHGVLVEAGTTLRGRGGATRGPKAAARREELLALARSTARRKG